VSETPFDGLSPLQAAVIGLTGCIHDAFPDVCSFGLTIGESYVPFDPDDDDGCEDDEVACTQGWVRVTGAGITEVQDSFEKGGCGGTQEVGIEVGILRCVEVPEDGEAPKATEVMVAALQSLEDMNTIYCAAMSCEAVEDLNVGQWTPLGPLGGQYGGMWSFTMEIV